MGWRVWCAYGHAQSVELNDSGSEASNNDVLFGLVLETGPSVAQADLKFVM